MSVENEKGKFLAIHDYCNQHDVQNTGGLQHFFKLQIVFLQYNIGPNWTSPVAAGI